MSFLSHSRRPRRAGEWSAARAVTFIVTLAATQSVTLAARRAGISRRSAYALKQRDPAFAYAWTAAMNARQGNKVEEVDEAPIPSTQGNRPLSRLARNKAFARHLAALRDSVALAQLPRAQ